MRFVLDTNQVSQLVHTPSTGGRPNLVIPLLVWAEILLAPACHHQERIRAISECDIVFGMDVPDVYQRLCTLTEDQIRQFDPVFSTDSHEHNLLHTSFSEPRDELLARARELKQGAAEDARRLSDRLAQYRREDHVAKSKGEERNYERKFTDIDDADARFVSGDTAPFRTKFVDDVTDMTLPLYARDGDTVLTNDRFLRKAIRHVDPKRNVTLSTWGETVSRNA